MTYFILLCYIIAAVCLHRVFALTFFGAESYDISNLAKFLSRPLQIVFAFALISAGVFGGFKPMPLGTPLLELEMLGEIGEMGELMSSSALQTSALSLPPIDLNALPAWYVYAPTDTDGDGLPDFWEIGTHGNPFVHDSELDRDGDGLTDLQEFYYQTNPRRVDTDADGFHDGYEMLRGMNPLVKDDTANPYEPDLNKNGIPDIWQSQHGWLLDNYYLFRDDNGDEWDDNYAAWSRPLESAGNFDVVVHIRTSRSAALNWGGDKFILFPAGSDKRIRLRLSFNEEFVVALNPSPHGVSVQAGELWKASMSIDFLPRLGQTVTGNALIGQDGEITLRTKTLENTIKCFDAPASAPMGRMGIMSVLSGDDGDTPPDNPQSKFTHHGFDLLPSSYLVHYLVGTAGPFYVTNLVGVSTSSIRWTVDPNHGTMSSSDGESSTLHIQPEAWMHVATIIVTAEAALDDDTTVTRTSNVLSCDNHTFQTSVSTNNFSPHMGEMLETHVRIPGCMHEAEAKWLEIEVMRETVGGFQHVAWYNLGLDAEENGRRLDVSRLGGITVVNSWNGKADTTLGIAEHPDEFKNGKHSFNRKMPAIENGKVVPPPFYHIMARLFDSETNLVTFVHTHKVYVPQVVKVNWTAWGIGKLKDTIIAEPSSGAPARTLYLGYSGTIFDLVVSAKSDIKGRLSHGNIRIASNFLDTVVETNSVIILNIEGGDFVARTHDGKLATCLGTTFNHASLQQNPGASCAVWVGSIYATTQAVFKEEKKQKWRQFHPPSDPFPVPINNDNITELIYKNATHEVGHALGLVDPDHLSGDKGGHNKEHTKHFYMHKNTDLKWFYNAHPAYQWKKLNAEYLQFVLPHPKE